MNILITGANSGIGLASAGLLAQAGHQVTITARDESKLALAQQKIEQHYACKVSGLRLDLADFDSIKTCAAKINAREQGLDILINNAGLSLSERRETAQGFEYVLAVNAIGPQMFTGLLLDKLLQSDAPRVLNLSSAGHVGARKGMDWDDLQRQTRYSGQAYCQAKLAVIYFSQELARRYSEQGLQSYAINPGFVSTQFGMDGDARGIGYLFFLLGKYWMQKPEQGAATTVWACAAEISQHNGAYLQKAAVSQGSSHSRNPEAAKRWWDLCQRWIAQERPD